MDKTVKTIKVFFDDYPLKSAHKKRGIGVYSRHVLQGLDLLKDITLVKRIDQADIIHYPYFDFFDNTLKIYPDKKHIVTIYDTIPLIYPSHYKPGLRRKVVFYLQRWKLQKVSAVITISETSKKDIVRFLNIPQEKIYPIYLGASFSPYKLSQHSLETIRKKYQLSQKFILYVGDVNYNKNVEGLIQAFWLLSKCKDLLLVLVGEAFTKDIPEARSIKELIRVKRLQKKVRILGFLPEKDLSAVYKLATVYCQPSFYEGFGLPMLDAMMHGVPVVAAKNQALREVGDNACLFADPYSPSCVAEAIIQVLDNDDLAKHLARVGRSRARTFSWDKTIQEIQNVYKKILD